MEISVVILSHEDMRRAVTKYLCDVLDGQVQVNSIRTLKGQRGFAVDLAIFEPPEGDVDASRYPIAEEG
jgi:hypothetical protein